MSYFLNTYPVQVSNNIVVDPRNVLILSDTERNILSPVYPLPNTLTTAIPGTLSTIFTSNNVVEQNNVSNATLYRFPLEPYYDLNLDPNVHQTVANSVYKKVFEDWIYGNEFSDLFGYLQIVNDRVSLISEKHKDKSYNEFDKNKKIRFMSEHILSRRRVKKLIQHFVDNTKTNWYDVEKNNYFVKELIHRYMKKKLKALVEKKNKKHA